MQQANDGVDVASDTEYSDGTSSRPPARRGVRDDPVLEALLRATANGCRNSFASLYSLTSHYLLYAIVRINGDAAESKDVLQEVYLKVWKRSEQFDPCKGLAIHWLRGIARNCALDALRARAHQPPSAGVPDDDDDQLDGLASGAPSPLEALIAGRNSERVRRALCGLSKPQREVICMAYYDELSCTQIAARMGRPTGTVKTWLRRALIDLRSTLAQQR